MVHYRDAITDVPLPTDVQIRAFAAFVAADHSWYKKLPLSGPGEPFFVYLHPHPHAVRVVDGKGHSAWRPIVRDRRSGSTPFHDWSIDLVEGDEPPNVVGLNHLAGGMSTAEYVERFGHWSYWNWGPPGQPRAAAVEQAHHQIAVETDEGTARVPREALEVGLVYLRATVSGHLLPAESVEYERLRAAEGLPTIEDDHAVQVQELETAMRRVAHWAS